MKTSTKIAIGLSIAAAAVAIFAAGVIFELKAIRKITTDVDDALPEEILAQEPAEIADAE